MRELAFPGKSFADLFTITTKDDPGVPWTFTDHTWSKRANRSIARKATIRIGPYMAVTGVGGYRSLYVRPSVDLVAHIQAYMIAAGANDAITFEAVNRDGGETLLVAKNSTIIGSRWLAIVPTDTIPAEVE